MGSSQRTEQEQQIKITLRDGSTLILRATVHGPYAVHSQIIRKAPGTGWAVTHVRSGVLIWKTRYRTQAERVARWLHEHGPIPPDLSMQELYAWVPGRRDELRHLYTTLHSIAPRWSGAAAEG